MSITYGVCLLLIYYPIIINGAINGSNTEQMTQLFGRPVGHKTNLLTAGYHGPALLQDVQFLEEMAHFDRERIPERVVHAKGSGAFGVFRVTNPQITRYTNAALFSTSGKKTEVAVRFSTVAGEKGSADTIFGDPRGFAVKFYTEEGNWDLVGNNVPIFFIRDAMQFPSLIHANKRNTATGLKDPNYLWDFNSLRPETLNLITYMFSDFGIPDGWRHMPGFSIHAFKLVNSDGKHVYAKFHWIPKQGIKNLDVDTATQLRGTDPDYARQDLYEAIANGKYPSWTLMIQVITEQEARRFSFNPFDATKIWPIDKYPLIEVGVMTLNRNPSNFFAEVEQIALCPANLVPGIEPSPDLLLAGRLFSYGDTQRYRLGSNHQLIPVNRAKNKVMAPTQRDGSMRTDDNEGNSPNYFPNSYNGISDKQRMMDSNITLNDNRNDEIVVFRYDDKDDHNYEQPRDFYRSLTKDWRERLHRNIAMALKGAHGFIIDRQLKEISKVDQNYADGVQQELTKIIKKNPKRQTINTKPVKTATRRVKTSSRSGSRKRSSDDSNNNGSEWIDNGWRRSGSPSTSRRYYGNNG
ncbi:catalase-like [Oppia nitens]|uniref:catalase-like n=1 Tax=Oppia nitens TaxID=1686743 RepID=UPI0023DA3DA5|nr:catalase-like [Oppia nitens]XP_054161355.1 catalase-like [Oppia nitens]